MPDSAAELLLPFVRKLRQAGVAVSLVETTDAVRALSAVGAEQRPRVKAALQASLIKRVDEVAVFDRVFESLFRAPAPAGETGANSDIGAESSTELLESLVEALKSGDMAALNGLAEQAVDLHAGIGSGHGSGPRYYLYRVLRRLDLARLAQQAGWELDAGGGNAENRQVVDERTARLRALLAQVIGSRLSSDAPDAAPIDEVDFLRATDQQLAEMRAAIQPLARRLAARLARADRVRGRGRLDVRRTYRRSLASGGVPIEPAFRRPRRRRPDLWLLCDVSGSVAPFAEFTLSLLNALNQEIGRLRSFVFVDGVAEVSQLFAGGQTASLRQLLWQPELLKGDGHSDYGRALAAFLPSLRGAANPGKTTLIITGDARDNFHGGGATELAELARQTRRLYWMNPEPQAEWDSADSAHSRFALHCTAVVEVRTLRQLGDFVVSIV